MRKYFILSAFFISITFQIDAQSVFSDSLPLTVDSVALHYATTINESDLKNYLSILASDALEGRETGSRGQKMAAAFIREHFRDNNLLPIVRRNADSLYFQKFDLYRNSYGEVFIEKAGTKYYHLESLIFNGNHNIPIAKEMPFQFIGDGELVDYEGINVQGSLVAFWAKTSEEIRRKIALAKERGAAGFYVITLQNQADFQEYTHKNAHLFESVSITKQPAENGSTLLFLGHFELVAKLLEVDPEKLTKIYQKTGRTSKNRYRKLHAEIKLKIEKISEKFQSENVLGFIEGTEKKEELVVVTAHYDHVGKKGDLIFNGADDDGSGTAAVMELAQAFAIAKKHGNGPKRSLLFMTVAGEENGLLGSEYYSENPAWPLSNTVANLNIDMIGRVDPFHESQDQYVYIIGSDRLSMDLHSINEQVNKLYTGLELDYKYNADDDPNRFYYRSDHYNFARHNIPIIFYFNGTHADYHQPGDTIDKIRFDLLKKRSDLIFYCAWELANRSARIRLKQ
jgi:hypothetical protein